MQTSNFILTYCSCSGTFFQVLWENMTVIPGEILWSQEIGQLTSILTKYSLFSTFIITECLGEMVQYSSSKQNIVLGYVGGYARESPHIVVPCHSALHWSKNLWPLTKKRGDVIQMWPCDFGFVPMHSFGGRVGSWKNCWCHSSLVMHCLVWTTNRVHPFTCLLPAFNSEGRRRWCWIFTMT